MDAVFAALPLEGVICVVEVALAVLPQIRFIFLVEVFHDALLAYGRYIEARFLRVAQYAGGTTFGHALDATRAGRGGTRARLGK